MSKRKASEGLGEGDQPSKRPRGSRADDSGDLLTNIEHALEAKDTQQTERIESEVKRGIEALPVTFEDSDEDEDDGKVKMRKRRPEQVQEAMDEESENEEEGEDTRMTTNLGSIRDERGHHEEKQTLDLHAIDAHWIQRRLGELDEEEEEATVREERAAAAFAILSNPENDTHTKVESELLLLFNFLHFEFVKTLVQNRWEIVYQIKLSQAGGNQEEREAVEREMRERGMISADGKAQATDTATTARSGDAPSKQQTADNTQTHTSSSAAVSELNLTNIAFQDGGRLMTNQQVQLPHGTIRETHKTHDEVHVPACKPLYDPDFKPIKVDSLPEWAQPAFTGMTELNRIQTKVFPVAFEQPTQNLLMCAPTGAGKTNVAMLCVLAELQKCLVEGDDGAEFDLDTLKIVYVAPMKALVQEVAHNFSTRLAPYGVKVEELTGDRQMTKEQISQTHMIVTTPEKWDVVTRKNRGSVNMWVKLIIIDEIHLLHDNRGPVLEAIVTRSAREAIETKQPTRLVGLSATLPNYKDVAVFLQVNPDIGLHHFDAKYRPVPLTAQYIGVREKKPGKRKEIMDEIVYEKVVDRVQRDQVLVFVHSRKDTGITASNIKTKAQEEGVLEKFIQADGAAREILTSEAENAESEILKELLPYGLGIHHAGMTRPDRTLIEDLFRDGHIRVLVCTATLAWGVNLPAHTVIIKGTQVYNPEKGKWMELSPLDVMQMMGRAGRPPFDSEGEGIILTAHGDLQYYLSLMNAQLPIESQLVAKLPDQLNAEIVLGTVRNVKDAVDWLAHTYLYIRMMRNPALYHVNEEAKADDPQLEGFRSDLIRAAATQLDKHNLVKFDRRTGNFTATDMGKVASHYYLAHQSISTYNDGLKAHLSDIEIFQLFSTSHEFKYVSVRADEKMELQKMLERVPIPVRESADEPAAKVNVLLQAYISNLSLKGFALVSDMVYVSQSASRIFRALHEIAIRKGWAQLTRTLMDISKMVDRKMWMAHNPLRQFPKVPDELAAKLEKKDLTWERYYDLSPEDLGDLVKNRKAGKALYKCVHQLPRLDVAAHVQPVTRSTLRIELTITPDFQYEADVHGGAQVFWVIVEDANQEFILHYEQFLLKRSQAKDESFVFFTVPILEPLPPQYFVRVVSDRWLWSETVLPVSFRRLILPAPHPAPTELLELHPLPISALKDNRFEAMYRDEFKELTAMQTQTFYTLYTTDDNCLICAPTGMGKTFCLELAILRMFKEQQQDDEGKCVYIAPFETVAKQRAEEWKKKFSDMGPGYEVVCLTGESSADLKLLDRGRVIVATPEQWDVLSRRWKQRRGVRAVKLVLCDDMHMIGGVGGPVYEVVVSRMRYISSQIQAESGKIRIVGAATSLAHARDVGEWMGATQQTIYNFPASVHRVATDIHILGFEHRAELSGKARLSWKAYADEKPCIIFVQSKQACYDVAAELQTLVEEDDSPYRNGLREELEKYGKWVNDEFVAEALYDGIGIFHNNMTANVKKIVQRLFNTGKIKVLVAVWDVAWSLEAVASTVIVLGAQYYDPREQREHDYRIADVLQMLGRASTGESCKCVLHCPNSKKDYFKKFVTEPIPVESHLDHYLADHVNAEIVTRTIESKQDAVDYLTWTYMYRRLKQNPNYYNLQGISHAHMSDYLSELVENTVDALEQSKCIEVDEEDGSLKPQNLGIIASFYYIQYTTVETFSGSLGARIQKNGLLKILANSGEFEGINLLDAKSTIQELFQWHFNRKRISPEAELDRQAVVEKALPLTQALVDVIASHRWMIPAVAAMELSQMFVQGLGHQDSPLRQLPHVTATMAKDLEENKGIESVPEITEMSDEAFEALGLPLPEDKLRDVREAARRFPDVEMQFQVLDKDDLHANSTMVIAVQLKRKNTTEATVKNSYFPKEKEEAWWLVVGDEEKNVLCSIKRATLVSTGNIKLSFTAPKAPGDHTLKVMLVSDSYIGVDQEYDCKFHLGEAEEDSDDDMSE